jgi:hypothetical protein
LEEGGDVVLQLVTGLFVIVHHMTAEIATGGDVAAELGGGDPATGSRVAADFQSRTSSS